MTQIRKTTMSKSETHYISEKIRWQFDLTISNETIYSLVDVIINRGIGDWGVITKITTINNTMQTGEKNYQYTLPIEVACIETNEAALITKDLIMCAISKTLIDFPYALDTVAGYSLAVDRLTDEDIDEIIQVAVFGSLKYGFAWTK